VPSFRFDNFIYLQGLVRNIDLVNCVGGAEIGAAHAVVDRFARGLMRLPVPDHGVSVVNG
jgi:hypothetical protein